MGPFTRDDTPSMNGCSPGPIDAQLRLLAPAKVSDDEKLVEYESLLLDRFLDILQDLHDEHLRETIQETYGLAAEYEGQRDPGKLEDLGAVLTRLNPGDSIIVAKAFSHMLILANLAEEVQITHRRRIKLKKGDFADENSVTTKSDIEETLKRLVKDIRKLSEEVFNTLKNQTVDLVLTAHPTQSVRRSLSQKHGRVRDCLAQLYGKDITFDDKQELDEALQREVPFGMVVPCPECMMAIVVAQPQHGIQVIASQEINWVRDEPRASQEKRDCI